MLCALNVFFRQYNDAKTDLSKFFEENFHHKNTEEAIKITITFTNLPEKAKNDLSDYVRQGKLTVFSIAEYNLQTGSAEVRQYGSRLVLDDFRPFFEANKKGAKVSELKKIFDGLGRKYSDLTDEKTKVGMIATLQKYEARNPGDCELTQSEDQFYGVSKGANRLHLIFNGCSCLQLKMRQWNRRNQKIQH